MKLFLITLSCLCLVNTYAQQRPTTIIADTLLKNIEQDVWIPFMEAYKYGDSEKLKSIHSKNIIRVTLDQNRIETGEPDRKSVV